MTIANLFAQHREGRVSKEKFLYEARKDAQLPFISNLTSYDDAIKILKQRGVIKESVSPLKEEVSEAKDGFAVDKSYTHFALNRKDNKIATGWDYKGLDSDEIKHWAKIDLKDMELNPANYAILKTASLIRLGINPFNWDNWAKPTVSGEKEDLNEQKDLSLEIDRMNPKIVAKAIDFEMEKLPASEMTLDNYFKTQKKVVNELKKNPKAYDDLFVANSSEMEKTDKTLQMQPVKKDNLKDKPNEMVKAKLKEAVLKMLNEEHEIDYAPNNIVKLPEGGEGTIIEVKGGTLTIEMEDGSQKHYQMNVIKHANNPETIAKEEKSSESKDELMEKIAKFLKALKDKKKLKTELTVVPTPQTVAKQKKEVDSDNTLPSDKKAAVKVALDRGETVKYGK